MAGGTDPERSLRARVARLPVAEELKVLANKRDVPYQSLLKVFLAERIERELRKQKSTKTSLM